MYLQSRSDVDPNRIGLYGPSFGGLLTARGKITLFVEILL